MTGSGDAIGRWLAGAIQVGTLAAAGLMLVGLVLGRGTITWLGLLLLALTPALQLGVAAVGFGRVREMRYSLIAALVLSLLLAGLGAAVLVAQGVGA